MLKRFSLRYVALSSFLDAVCVVISLALADHLRQTLPYGRVGYYSQGIPRSEVYVLAAGLWVLIAFAVSLYDPKKIYKAVDEFQTLTLAVGFYSLGIAGVLYFTYRNTSRLLMLYALACTWVLLTLWRMCTRLIYRAGRHRSQHTTRVLIAGAGEVGRRVAAMIDEYRWVGLEACWLSR